MIAVVICWARSFGRDTRQLAADDLTTQIVVGSIGPCITVLAECNVTVAKAVVVESSASTIIGVVSTAIVVSASADVVTSAAVIVSTSDNAVVSGAKVIDVSDDATADAVGCVVKTSEVESAVSKDGYKTTISQFPVLSSSCALYRLTGEPRLASTGECGVGNKTPDGH